MGTGSGAGEHGGGSGVADPQAAGGSFVPSLLERRHRVDQSLFAVIMEAYLHGTSTRKVDDVGQGARGGRGISKSDVGAL
jgi:putative transposase